MYRFVVLGVIGTIALVGCGGSGSTNSDSASVDTAGTEQASSSEATETRFAADEASHTCAEAFNGMSKQEKMSIAFKTSNLANAPGNTPTQYTEAIRVSIGGLADDSSQCLITIMYPPTPAEFQAARSIGREANFVADQFSYYSDGSSLERGATGPVSSLPDSVRTQNATLSLSGSANDLDVQVSVK